MEKKLIAAPALAGLIALPVAGYLAGELVKQPRAVVQSEPVATPPVAVPPPLATAPQETQREAADELLARPAPATRAAEPQTAARQRTLDLEQPKLMAPEAPSAAMPEPSGDQAASGEAASIEEGERVQSFETNPVKVTAENPVSTFSLDVDTASYSFVRRSLRSGFLPDPETVRVEEMINYFPYDWKGPDTADIPFNTNVTMIPTPWNAKTRLMHVAIKGYDIKPAQKPRANLVFLLDVSGSMNEPDKLPLLKSAFRLLVNGLAPDDTVSIVTYAGESGTVLAPTKASERDTILHAIDTLQPGGSTAGAAGIEEAYRLAKQSFVEGGVNRVMLATDGDFNVGQTSDEDLKHIIEQKREQGIFLSVFGFGRGNLNDQMMQTLAQNGNGTAAYIDTLGEAEKVLVQDATATLFPIAKDVKIQVEFNSSMVSEYRLIGYETRALKREDFNNDRADAGEVGSGSSVTAIYEVTPKGSGGETVDDLRYGEAAVDHPTGIAHGDEWAFVKVRWKLPMDGSSKLVEKPVTSADAVPDFNAASVDQRFSVAVAAFGQKLRKTDQTASFTFDQITEIAAAARGADPFGYRSEFLSLVRLASALAGGKQ